MMLFPEKEPQKPPATYDNSRKTGFTENWSNALGLAMTEDLPITSRLIPTVAESQRNQKLHDYRKAGKIPENIFNFYGGDTDGLAYYARHTIGLDDIPTIEEFDKQKLEEYSANRERSGKVFAQQGKAGFVGEMAGRMHAMALDPIYATSFLTGYGTATTIGQAALRVGLMEAGIETVAQMPKMAWKEEIGADYGAAQAMTEIAFAGIGSAALAGLAKGLGRMMTPKDLTVEQGVKVFERIAKDNPELDPILNTLRQADPQDNLAKVMETDESIDINMSKQGAKANDPKNKADLKASEYTVQEEETFTSRVAQIVEHKQKIADEALQLQQEGEALSANIMKGLAPLTEEKAALTAVRKELKDLMKRRKFSPELSVDLQLIDDALEQVNKSILDQDIPGLMKNRASLMEARETALAKAKEIPALKETMKQVETVSETIEQITKSTPDGGVPRGTPKEKSIDTKTQPDTRHPMVVEADNEVLKLDDSIKIMEECF